jgi:hypothetical protein
MVTPRRRPGHTRYLCHLEPNWTKTTRVASDDSISRFHFSRGRLDGNKLFQTCDLSLDIIQQTSHDPRRRYPTRSIWTIYSNPKFQIPAEKDHRFMPNLISSSITSKSLPKAVADLLAARNKIHRFGHCTHETLLNIFDKDPGNSTKTGSNNRCTMPSRKYAIITETCGQSRDINGGSVKQNTDHSTPFLAGKNAQSSLHVGEDSVRTKHTAASCIHRGSTFEAHGLKVSLGVEIDRSDRKGHTEGYGLGGKYTIQVWNQLLTWMIQSLR